MATPNIMDLLAEAQLEVDEQKSWGVGRTETALDALLQFARMAVAQFDALTAQVTALETRVTALENPAPPPAP